MSIIGIVAVDRENAIGKAGTVPWHYPSDLRFFREQTTGHACVMGRRTWQSLKRPLKERLNIVLSRSVALAEQPGLVVLTSARAVLLLKPYLRSHLFVIGGASVYRAFQDEIEEWVVTEIPLTVEGADTFMPEGFLNGFVRHGTRELPDGLRVNFYRREPPTLPENG